MVLSDQGWDTERPLKKIKERLKMQTIKVMSIIGCVVFVISLICIFAWGDTPDNDAALGWGMIGCIYGVALSIVGVIQSSKKDIRRKRR